MRLGVTECRIHFFCIKSLPCSRHENHILYVEVNKYDKSKQWNEQKLNHQLGATLLQSGKLHWLLSAKHLAQHIQMKNHTVQYQGAPNPVCKMVNKEFWKLFGTGRTYGLWSSNNILRVLYHIGRHLWHPWPEPEVFSFPLQVEIFWVSKTAKKFTDHQFSETMCLLPWH